MVRARAPPPQVIRRLGKTRRGTLFAIALLASAARASAQEPAVEVTVQGEGTDRGGAEGRASSKVDRDEMDERLPRSAPDALRYEPGVFVQQTAHGAGSAFVRGRTGQQTVLAFDGIRLSNSTYRQGPNQYFFTIDARTIHSIEVIRGGASTLYGSDALGGVLDADPIEPTLTLGARGPVLRPRVAFRGATADGELGFRTQMDAQLDERLRVLVGAGSRRVGLLEGGGAVRSPATGEIPQVPALEDDGRTQLGTGFREMTADGRVVWELAPGQRVVAAAYVYRQYDSPRTDQCPPPFAPRSECLVYDEQFRTLVYGALEGRFGAAADEARLVLSYQRQHERRTRDRPGSFVENFGRDDVDTLGVAAKLGTREAVLAQWLTGRARYGADLYADAVGSQAWIRFTDVDVTRALSRGQYLDGSSHLQGGLYADLEGTVLERVIARAGGRAAFARAVAPGDEESGSARVDRAWPVLAGHAGLEVEATQAISVLAGVDRSYRTPNLDDLTSRQQTGPGFQLENPDLAPEKGTTFEAGVRVDTSFVEADAWAFRSILDDAITRAPRPVSACPPEVPQCASSWSRFQLVNVEGASTIDGFELSARLRLPAQVTLKGSVSYAFGEGPSPDPTDGEDARVPLSRIPPLNGSAELRWALPAPRGLRVGAALRWALAQDRLAIADRSDARIPVGGTPGFAVFDVRAAYRFEKNVLVSAVLENVGDAAYRYHGSSVNGPGRGLAVDCELGF